MIGLGFLAGAGFMGVCMGLWLWIEARRGAASVERVTPPPARPAALRFPGGGGPALSPTLTSEDAARLCGASLDPGGGI